MAPSLLGEEKKYKSRLLQWHGWAKVLGASDMKVLGMCRDIPLWAEEQLQGLVFDSERHRTFPGVENVWDRDSRETFLPEMIASYYWDRNQVPVWPRTGGMGQSVVSGLLRDDSALAPFRLQKTATPGGVPAGSLQQQRNAGSPVVGYSPPFRPP